MLPAEATSSAPPQARIAQHRWRPVPAYLELLHVSPRSRIITTTGPQPQALGNRWRATRVGHYDQGYYTAVAGVTILIQNRTPHTAMRIRVNGSSGTTSDALTAPYQTLQPFERMSIALSNADKVFASPDQPYAGKVTVAA